MTSPALSVDSLLRPHWPARSRVVVVADRDDWSLAFRSLLDRPGFEVPPTNVDWVRVSPLPSRGDHSVDETAPKGQSRLEGQSWWASAIQPKPAIMVWDADSLRIPRIAKMLRRCEVVAPQTAHLVVGRDLRPECRMNWTAIGVATTFRNPEDLWSQRRLIQRMLVQSVDCFEEQD